MPSQELIDYVEQNRKQGISDDQIRQTLADTGWPESQIAEIFLPKSVNIQQQTENTDAGSSKKYLS